MRRTTNHLWILLALAATAQGAAAQSRATLLSDVVGMEKEFSKASITEMTQLAFDKYLAPDAMLFRPRAVRASEWRLRSPLPRDLMLTWAPLFVDVSRAGDLAYTTGQWVSGSRSTQADPKFGDYVHVWEKQSSGQWRVVFEGSIATQPVAASPPAANLATAAGYKGSGTEGAHSNSLLAADNAFGTKAKRSSYPDALEPIADPNLRVMRNLVSTTVGFDEAEKMLRNTRVSVWTPVTAVSSKSGDVGYTRGRYNIGVPNGTTQQGDYLRVWRRDADGTWRVVVDFMSPAR